MTSDVSNAPVEPAAFSNEQVTELAVLQSEQSEMLTERVDQLERWRWRFLPIAMISRRRIKSSKRCDLLSTLATFLKIKFD